MMIKANVFVPAATLGEIADIVTGIIYDVGLDDYAIVSAEEKAGGVDMVVEFDTTFQYEEFIYELDMVMQSSVSTFMY